MDTPGKRLAFARERAKFRSASAAAHTLNVAVSTYNAHERAGEPGARKFGVKDAEKYARAFGVTASWLLLGVEEPAQPPASLPKEAPVLRPSVEPNASAPQPPPTISKRRIPVYGRAVGGDDGRFTFNGEIMGDVFCPTILDNVPEAYALEVTGDSMIPRFRPGETVWVNPKKNVHRGDDVVVQMHPAEEGGVVEGFIKEFVTYTPTMLVLKQHNPDIEIEIDRRAVVSVHKVVFQGFTS